METELTAKRTKPGDDDHGHVGGRGRVSKNGQEEEEEEDMGG